LIASGIVKLFFIKNKKPLNNSKQATRIEVHGWRLGAIRRMDNLQTNQTSHGMMPTAGHHPKNNGHAVKERRTAMHRLSRWIHTRFHYAWIVVGITFLIMLITAGARGAPGVMLVPLERDFGWDRGTISLATAINLALYGLSGPFAAAAMQYFGLRRTVLCALGVLAIATGLSSQMQALWQLQLLWGLLVGCATGTTAMTLGAAVVNRWFISRRGLAMGILTASSATGQLIFLPLFATITEHLGWRLMVLLIAAVALLMIPLIAGLMPERPADLGLHPLGEPEGTRHTATNKQNPIVQAFSILHQAAHSRDFWLLFFSFFVCGASTNGFIGTHFIAMCSDHGLSAVTGAGILAVMGIFDLFGTTLSGWLSDRIAPRILLFWYYGLRGLSLLFLPYAFNLALFGLPLFTVFYGLDWVATVPPTVRLTGDRFGRESSTIVFGWIVAGHQLGAAFAALTAGYLRSILGSYTLATLLSGTLCLIGALAVLWIGRSRTPVMGPG
jgi:predicted MFS family arabinose efflux permease